MLEPELPNIQAKYLAAGIMGQDGCIYFAPCCAGKVLRISTKGGVEVLMVSNKHNDGLIFPKGTFLFISVWANSVLTLFTMTINLSLIHI